jgi:hypothetical protein
MEIEFDFGGHNRLNAGRNYIMEASFSVDSVILPATIKNISLGGALIRTMNISNIRTGTELLISIPYTNENGCLKRKAKVKWVDNDLFGVEFI